ncbi:ABC transporter substrate-binding protein [Diaminobutyricibacter tongyongensis]|uniref:ABC transporter substrate-binding protein n=1 Tax=Leifsonia tongyongensis TaxID=1268043 RepID=A0A6L9Y208_9MICO|nr:substrate-binding domain-containing protein [Diaminobutyricibacter tongyongensis]NEN07690.1 ABC transporter substrate-binding protein [Diaminobutyricibacter tongyongensis]
MAMSISHSDSLVLLSALPLRDALTRDILPAFSAASGIGIRARFEPSSVIEQLIRAGEVPDLLIDTTGSIKEFTRQGVLLRNSATAVASSAIGIAVVEGRVVRRFETIASFLAFLLSARSVAYSPSEASGIYFETMLSRFGLRDEICSRATIFKDGLTATALSDGRADVAIQELSELAKVAGVQAMDAFPADLQRGTNYAVAIATRSSRTLSAASLIDALVSDSSRSAFERTGLRTPGSRRG